MTYCEELKKMDKDWDDYKLDKAITTAALAILEKLDETHDTLSNIEVHTPD